MNKAVVVTTTSYKSRQELRFQLACRTLQALHVLGYPVVVVDDSADPDIQEELSALGAEVFEQDEPGMAPSRREAFDHAAQLAILRGAGEILWTELEKTDIARHIETILAPVRAGELDIVVPTRTRASLATYPAFQAHAEAVVNTVYRQVLLLQADPTFGPVGFSLKCAPDFSECYPEEYGVEANYLQHAAPLIALANGRRVGTVEVDFRYPPEQKQEEDRDGPLFEAMVEKRLWQQSQLVEMYFTLAERLRLGLYAKA